MGTPWWNIPSRGIFGSMICQEQKGEGQALGEAVYTTCDKERFAEKQIKRKREIQINAICARSKGLRMNAAL